MLLLVIGTVLIMRWLTASTEVTPAQSMVGPEDQNFIVAHLDTTDPGVTSVLARLVQYAQQRTATQEHQPPPRQLTPQQEADQARTIAQMLPRVDIATTTRPRADGDQTMRFVSLGAFKNLVPMLLDFAMKKVPTSSYRGLTIYELQATDDAAPSPASHPSDAPASSASPVRPTPSPGHTETIYMTVSRANVIDANSLDGMHQAIDRFLSPSGSFGGSDAMKKLFDAVDSSKPVVGVDTDPPAVAQVLHAACEGPDAIFPAPPSWQAGLARQAAHLAYSIDFLSADQMAFTVLVDPHDAAAANQASHMLQTASARLQQEGHIQEAAVKTDKDQHVVLTFKVNDMSRRLRHLFDTTPTVPKDPLPSPPPVKTDTQVQ